MIYNDNSVYFSGSARLPVSIPSGEIYEFINVGLVIDKKTGLVQSISTTLLSPGAVKFLEYLIVGFNVHDEKIEVLINNIQTRYFGGSQKAICVAIKQAYDSYNIYKKF